MSTPTPIERVVEAIHSLNAELRAERVSQLIEESHAILIGLIADARPELRTRLFEIYDRVRELRDMHSGPPLRETA